MMERYQRQILLKEIGKEGQQRLQEAKVLVVGAGGLGSPVLQYLAAAGVGNITIADPDTLALHNLHRQVLFHTSQIGQNKAEAAAQNLSQLNPTLQIQTIPEGIHLQNFQNLIPHYDLILDGSDNFPTKYLVNDACYVYRKPLVYGAILQWEGQFAVFNHQNSPNLRDIFPFPPENAPTCSEAGILGPVAGIVGSLMANEALKILLQLNEYILTHHLFTLNLLSLTLKKIKFSRNPENPLHPNWNFEQHHYPSLCQTPPTQKPLEISLQALEHLQKSGQPYQLIDVREPYEHSENSLGGINIPLSKLSETELPPNIPIIFYCNSGERSKFCATLWRKKGYLAYSLTRQP